MKETPHDNDDVKEAVSLVVLMPKRTSNCVGKVFHSGAGANGVGCLSAINKQLSEEGLLTVVPLNLLVSEEPSSPHKK